MESTREAKTRRLQDMLIIAGDAVIAFSAWALVKAALFLTFADEDHLNRLLAADGVPIEAVAIVLIVVLLMDLAIRAFVGLSARAEGRGKKKGSFYLVIAVLAAMTNAASAILTILGMATTLSTLDTVVSIMVELTALAALVLLLYSAVSLRHLRRTTE